MKKLLILIFLLFNPLAYATQTVGYVPVTTTGSPTPVIQDSDIQDSSNSPNTKISFMSIPNVGNVGIGTANPGATLDIQGTLSRIRMQSPDGTEYKCHPANGGSFTCS